MIYNVDDLVFYILSIDTYRHEKGPETVQPREYSALSFRTEGVGKFRIQGKSFTAATGDICFIPAGAGYKVDYSGGESIVVHMMHCNYHEAEAITLSRAGYIGDKFRAMLAAWDQGHQINRAKAHVYDILQAVSEDQSTSFDGVFVSCLQYLQTHYTAPALRIADVCKAVGLSESSLYRRFVACCNQSPKEYLQHLRLRHAIELLLRGEMSVREVAFHSGFEDEKYFSRFVSEKLGHPPSAIRKYPPSQAEQMGV